MGGQCRASVGIVVTESIFTYVTHMCVWIFVFIYIYIYVYVHMHICIHTCLMCIGIHVFFGGLALDVYMLRLRQGSCRVPRWSCLKPCFAHIHTYAHTISAVVRVSMQLTPTWDTPQKYDMRWQVDADEWTVISSPKLSPVRTAVRQVRE